MMKVRNQPKSRRVITQLAIQRCEDVTRYVVKTQQDNVHNVFLQTSRHVVTTIRAMLSRRHRRRCLLPFHNVWTTFFLFHGIKFVQLCAKLKVARHFFGYISHKIRFKKKKIGFIFGPIFFKLLTLNTKFSKFLFIIFKYLLLIVLKNL